jgi:lipoprotein NlpI
MRSLFVLGLMYMVAVGGEDTPRANLDQGVADLRAGRIAEAVTRLDRVVAQDPASEPYLWQRGIAQYFAGDFKGGRKQFESHRTVNPNDVENATWHFLCVAASDGVDAARGAFLPAPGDSRAPMNEIHALYKGTGDRAAVEAAVNKFPQGTPRYRDARFYADLYIGLLAHAEGNKEEAAKYLQAAADVPEESVMADVARISHKLLVKADQPKESSEPK